ncbi:MAG: SIS domain-containing protein [Oscillospiraceae bacterium]|jgi:D-sedoheptulose 7-phosphate isomerase|nr:SIS domain-containing protein [Oscillospiraceae bacterium]
MKPAAQALLDSFYAREDALSCTRGALTAAVEALLRCFAAGGKLLTAGNGGSAADAEHITGELLKSFRCKRPLEPAFVEEYTRRFGDDGLVQRLEGSLPAIFLGGNFAILTATLNDIGAEAAFAQQALGLCAPGDVLLCISTSGNSKPLLAAMRVAQLRGATCVLLTGRSGGAMRELADIAIQAPADATYRIQEIHVMLYHQLCAAVEAEYWGANV